MFKFNDKFSDFSIRFFMKLLFLKILIYNIFYQESKFYLIFINFQFNKMKFKKY